jgi:hypothetical protein
MKKGKKTPLSSFKERTYRQPSLTEPQLFPEPYRIKSTFGSIHLTNPNPSSTTFNALLSPTLTNMNTITTPDADGSGTVRRRSHNELSFEKLRRNSFAENIVSHFTSMEIPDMKDIQNNSMSRNPVSEDLEGALQTPSREHLASLTPGFQQTPVPKTYTEDELDEEQLDMCVNEILGGLADLEEYNPTH